MIKKLTAALLCLMILLMSCAIADINYRITLSSQYISIAPGGTQHISASITPVNLNEHTITWSSENEYVATVSNKGVITAHAAGTTRIACTMETGTVKYVTVAVTGNPVRFISINESETEIEAGQTQKLTYTIDDTADDLRVKWSSSDTSVAAVDSTGLVKAVSGGTAVITVTAVNGITASATVYVPSDVKRIEINPDDIYISPGSSEQLDAYIYPGNARNRELTWQSNNESVAVVDENGVVTAVSEGNCLIKASAENGVYAIAGIHAVKLPEKTSFSEDTVILTKNNRTRKLTVNCYPADTQGAFLTWETADKAVADVAQDGTVTANGFGTTKITATTLNGLSCVCNLRVCDTPSEVEFSTKTYSVPMEGAPVKTVIRFSPVDSYEPGAVYSSDSKSIFTVDSDGFITPVAPGSGILKVTYPSGLTAEAAVTVYENATNLFLKSNHIYMYAGTVQPLAIYTNSGNEYAFPITTSTDSSSVASYANGYVIARAEGTALITLRGINDGLTCSLAVTVYPQQSESELKTVALTFDNGPSEHTPEILATLDRYGVNATFFLLGKSIEAHPAEAAALADTTHEIGNHTYSNASVNSQTMSEVASQISSTDKLIMGSVGRPATLLRAPDARLSPSLFDSFLDARRYVGRGVDAGDLTGADAETIINNAIYGCYDTAILTLHDEGPETAKVVEKLIPELMMQGYRFVTVSELIDITGITEGLFSTAR